MTKEILIIDDHSPIIEGYKSILSFSDHGYLLKFKEAQNCETAYGQIINIENCFDIVFLDLSLAPYDNMKINSGEDLIPYIKKHQPNSKIIISTSHSEYFLLYKIYQKLKPEGILIKSDFTPKEFLTAFSEIINGENYFSECVIKAIKSLNAADFYLDSIDMHIITLLSRGVKSKNLPDHLSIGISAIDKRKQKIKDFLFIEKGNDEDILREAKKRKYI